MRNFTTVLPDADLILAEKRFVNLARQAGMTSHFNVATGTRLEDSGEYPE